MQKENRAGWPGFLCVVWDAAGRPTRDGFRARGRVTSATRRGLARENAFGRVEASCSAFPRASQEKRKAGDEVLGRRECKPDANLGIPIRPEVDESNYLTVKGLQEPP